MGKLQNRVCLITGASGIAAATAELAAQEGARIFIAGLDDQQCQELAHKIQGHGTECDFHAADLRLASSASEVVARCISRFDRIDALYNVAGISGRKYGDGPVHECKEDAWNRIFDTNVKSMFLLCRSVIGQMLSQTVNENGVRGTILNMASVLGFSPEPIFFATHAYAASKGAIIALSRAMASYYASTKIRVNAIAPGLVRTPMSRRAQQNKEIIEFMKIKQPLREDLIDVEDVARVSVFLLSDESRMITGEVVTVDAGWCVS